MVRALFPGTFDPIHYGHIDIAVRAARLFDGYLSTGLVTESHKHPLIRDWNHQKISRDLAVGDWDSVAEEALGFMQSRLGA